MAWNEPGGNRDPWGGGRRPGGKPPDLDEMLKRLKARFSGGGGGGKSGGMGLGNGGWLIAVLVVALWLLSGFYKIDERERGVVLQFGKFARTTEPGLRWHLPWPIESVEKVNVTEVRESTDRAVMLTEDENIVELELKVQYRVSSAKDYLFNVRDPDATLRQATKSAVREVVGHSSFDFVVIEGREAVADRTKEGLQKMLDEYGTGLFVTQVNLRDARAPQQVQDAFLDAIKAREDQQRVKNEAEAYANDRLPRARGQAARDLEEARAYRDRAIARAEGDASRFTQLLREYKKAPKVTRERLYLETIGQVLNRSSKVVVDVDKGSPLIYLPLEQLMRQSGSADTEPAIPYSSGSSSGSGSSGSDYRSRDRSKR